MKALSLIILIGFFLTLQVSVGAAGLKCMEELTGSWLEDFTRPLGRQIKTALLLPFFVLLIFLVAGHLFPWAQPEIWKTHPQMHNKADYFSAPWTWLRSLIYLGCWLSVCAVYFRRRRVPGPGWVLTAFFLTVHWAAVDWLMSLDLEWQSSLFPPHVAVSSLLTALAVLLFFSPPKAGQSNTLGKILLVLVMVWAYFQFCQYIIIWSAQIPHEEIWFEQRRHGWALWLSLAVIGTQFVLPFGLLIFQKIRRNPGALRAVAGLILLARLLEISWWVLPSVSGGYGG